MENKTEWITIKNRFTGKKVFFTAIYLCAKYLILVKKRWFVLRLIKQY